MTVDIYDDQFDFEHESTADDKLLDDEDRWCEALSHAEISVPRQTLTEFISEYCAVRNLNIDEVTGPHANATSRQFEPPLPIKHYDLESPRLQRSLENLIVRNQLYSEP